MEKKFFFYFNHFFFVVVKMDHKDPESSISEKKLVEFMHDLEKALKNGKINHSNETNQSFLSMDNLSNQTFMYIVNWLKSHQIKIEEKVCEC